MPFNGNGVYAAPALPGSWNPATTGSSATPADWNTLLADISTALSTTITKDGQTTVTADIPMAGHKFTGLGNGTALTDSLALGQAWSVFGTPQTVVGQGFIDFTGIPTTFKNLMLVYRVIPATNGANLLLQMYGTTGVLDTGANYSYASWAVSSASTTSPNGATGSSAILIAGSVSSNAAFGNMGCINLADIQRAQSTGCVFNSTYLDAGGVARIASSGAGWHEVLANITGLRLSFSGGNLDGTATLLVC